MKVFGKGILMLGIDLGSRTVKMVIMNADYEIMSANKFDTVDFYRRYSRQTSSGLCIDLTGLGIAAGEQIVSTGYGRLAVQVEGAVNVPEIQAHALGAVQQTGLTDFTLVDIGGQDTKIIKIRSGQVADFMTNDRCAASSGRYLENMAAVIGVDLATMGQYYQNPVELNSTCAVFGETEIIAHIVEGVDTPALVAGVNYSLFKRFSFMLDKLLSDIVVMSGGVALNQALACILEKEKPVQIVPLIHPQLNGALGCCVYGLQH